MNSFCDVQEENHWKKESYQACWLSLVLETRPQYRQTLSEKDSVGKESYKQQQVVHFIVERSPCQTLRLSSSSGATAEHQLPLLKTSKGLSQEESTRECSKQQRLMESSEIQETRTVLISDLTKPIQSNFRALNLFSPRESSHLGQRRE